MMRFTVNLDVKFRAFGITFSHVNQSFVFHVPSIAARLVAFTQRGVSLTIDAAPEPSNGP
jgi:hypothetical protein